MRWYQRPLTFLYQRCPQQIDNPQHVGITAEPSGAVGIAAILENK